MSGGEPSSRPTGYFDGWDTIGEQQDFYDEQDCLHPSHNLASEKLKSRKDDEVVIFDYSLIPDYLTVVDGNAQIEEGGPFLEYPTADDDLFFRVSKDELLGSEQFDQLINPKEELARLSWGPRLGIM